jgi:hypothetical protein
MSPFKDAAMPSLACPKQKFCQGKKNQSPSISKGFKDDNWRDNDKGWGVRKQAGAKWDKPGLKLRGPGFYYFSESGWLPRSPLPFFTLCIAAKQKGCQWGKKAKLLIIQQILKTGGELQKRKNGD